MRVRIVLGNHRWLFVAMTALALAQAAEVGDAKSRVVSIVNLLTAPQEFRGDRVIVYGFVREQGGFLRLYLTREDGQMGNDGSSIVIRDDSPRSSLIDDSMCHESYVEVIGKFDLVEQLGVLGIVSVESITRFELSEDSVEHRPCWPPNKK